MQVHDCIWQKLYESINFCNDTNDHGFFQNGNGENQKKKKINAIHRTIAFTMDSNRLSSANALRNLMGIKANKDRSVPNTKDTVVEPEKELDPVFSQLLDKNIDLEQVIANDRKRLSIPDDLVLSEDHRFYLAKKLLELEELKKTIKHGLALHESNYRYKSDHKRGVVRDSSSSSSSAASGLVSSSDNYSCKDKTKTEFTSGSTSASGSSYSCSNGNCFSWDKYEGPIQYQGSTNLCYLYAAYGVAEYLVGQELGTSGTVFSPEEANTCSDVAKTCPSGAALDKGLQLLCGGAYQDQTDDCNNLDKNASIFQTGSILKSKNYIFEIRSEPTINDINTMIEKLSISPIIIGIDGSSNAIQNYYPTPTSSGEPLTPLCTTYYDHAVVIVGYDESTNVFKIRNSWGTKWGDDGYFYLDAIPGNYGLGTAYIYNIYLGSNQGCPGFTSCKNSSTGSALAGASDTNCCSDVCTVTEWQSSYPPQLMGTGQLVNSSCPDNLNLKLDDGTVFAYPNQSNYTYEGTSLWTTSNLAENASQRFILYYMNIVFLPTPNSPPNQYYYYTDLWDLTKDPPTSTICTGPTELSKSVNTSGTLSNIDVGVPISGTTYPQYWYMDDSTKKKKSFYMFLVFTGGAGYVALFFSDGTVKVYDSSKKIAINTNYTMEISINNTTSSATYKITSPISS